MINYGKQSVTASDVEAVTEQLKSSFLTQGPTVKQFEASVAANSNADYGISFSSATSALHGACAALGVGPGDIVWTAAMSFVASANCAIYCGATVGFVDVEPNTGNMSIEDLKEKLHEASAVGLLPKVLIPVHFAGQPCDLEEISRLAKQFGFKVIEDASHALGATYAGEPVGNSKFSDITVFSFHPVKIITTGEGGMCVTNSAELSEKLTRFRGHGITRDASESGAAVDGPWSYDQIELGYNYRLTDIQAALGISQLKRLDSFVSRRNEIADLYQALLDSSEWKPLEQKPSRTNSRHLFVVTNDLGYDARAELYGKLLRNDIQANVHYRPIYRNTYYARMNKYNPADYPGAERYYASALSLPMYFDLEDSQVHLVAAVVGS
jgi:UDP-4-amino-4,6-dideoxy-N-acetyl-beta-L-altrosamine transaminase